MSKFGRMGAALYQGDVSIEFVQRRRTWYLISLAILLVAVASLLFRGLNYGIEFRGGVEFQAQISDPSSKVETVTSSVVDTGIEAAQNPVVVASNNDSVRVQTEPLTLDEINVITKALTDDGSTEVSTSSIGPTWGQAIAKKALTGLIVFVILVILFIWAYFREWRMSVAAIVALAHDLLITVGVYSLTGFEVTPATVTGFLTILGFSLYDTVVVFDKVRENTRNITASTRRTYAEAANLALNQTLVRSINTSIAALLPVGAILYVGAFQLGSGPLKDLALALFVGMAAGAYSSIFIATPLLAQLKMREPSMQAQAKRVMARRGASGRMVVAETGLDADRESADPPDGDGEDTGDESSRPSTPVRAATATKTTKPAKTTARPMNSSSSKRAQPKRQARSKRGKR
jgi:preprotein translocase subunit SecF